MYVYIRTIKAHASPTIAVRHSTPCPQSKHLLSYLCMCYLLITRKGVCMLHSCAR